LVRIRYKFVDYVRPRFNESAAELKKPDGAGFSLEISLSAIAGSTGTNPMSKKKWKRRPVSRFYVTACSQPTPDAKGSTADQSSAPAPFAIIQGGVLGTPEESMFIRQGDYWTIRYQGQAAILKATRGLDCLAYLLRHPVRDVHVCELVATPIDLPAPALLGSLREAGGDAVTAWLQNAGPILDSRAKAEYKRRIDDLRKDTEEAERFNDFHRAARDRSEMDAIAEQLAAAVGLGGRDRRFLAEAERARSAVTKRIKEAINRIAEVIPPLGRHLAARIKTGYFCSYNPHPDRPVAWKF
jgi:hypothetical protein